MQIVTSIIISIIAVIFGGGAFYIAHKEHKEKKETEKKLAEAYENAEKMAKANEVKENANSGNIDNDVNYMADVLHQLAEKK